MEEYFEGLTDVTTTFFNPGGKRHVISPTFNLLWNIVFGIPFAVILGIVWIVSIGAVVAFFTAPVTLPIFLLVKYVEAGHEIAGGLILIGFSLIVTKLIVNETSYY